MGPVWFVDASVPASGGGLSPSSAFKTIAEAISAASGGDVITIGAGTYSEDVEVPTGKNGLELQFELGAVVRAQVGAAITVNSSYCRIVGNVHVIPVAAGTGVAVAGNWGYLDGLRVAAGSSGATGFDITGSGCVLFDCRCSEPTEVAFKIEGDKCKLDECCTGGNAATIGFWVTNSVTFIRLRECGSAGHQSAGFRIDAGVVNVVMRDCSSGGGDGAIVNNGTDVTLPGYKFDDWVYKGITLDASAATKAYNLFKVTGIVQIDLIFGHVETVLSNNHTDCHIDLWDGAADVDLSDPTGLTLNSAPVGSLIIRNGDSTELLDYGSAAAAFITENVGFKEARSPVVVGQKAGADTYVRFKHTTTNVPSSGGIHWHAQWQPISDDGFLEAA